MDKIGFREINWVSFRKIFQDIDHIIFSLHHEVFFISFCLNYYNAMHINENPFFDDELPQTPVTYAQGSSKNDYGPSPVQNPGCVTD
ncbi:Hypothetical protein CINCED_3A014667 [Cinara cedri]|uniref:Uncharacterized protein n=1 Tax=Cinara cedri TaxID=506608 RepID=A0A5E4M463_9HEMI|nr:Hypothetical protein CINCED_3A014667 [Cinara cedri]